MKITLELVRQVLKEALGFDSFVASFITEVREDKDHPTAGIAFVDADARVRQAGSTTAGIGAFTMALSYSQPSLEVLYGSVSFDRPNSFAARST